MEPPQSTSVSSWFWTPSKQLTHVSASQVLLTQSAPTRHDIPSPHGMQAPPPQSTSVSPPHRMPSLQLPAMQTKPEQQALTQSAGPRQGSPSSHGSHDPPQSMPVSSPLRTESSQAVSPTAPALAGAAGRPSAAQRPATTTIPTAETISPPLVSPTALPAVSTRSDCARRGFDPSL